MFKITTHELRDLIISFFVISLCFGILYVGRDFEALYTILPITMIGVGIGFILHELGHKYTSIHYGYWAEYKLWPAGLILALFSSFIGFVFAAPGAVYTYGNFIDTKEHGIISVAGSIVNIILAIIFLLIAIAIYPTITPFNEISQIGFLICALGFSINSYLAAFNMIPIWNLDGSKVLKWNGLVWLSVIGISGIMTYFSMTMGVENIVRIILGI